MNRNRTFAGLFRAAALLLICAGCGPGTAPGAAVDSSGDDFVTVKVVKPQVTTLKRTTTQPATVHAYHQAELYARQAGYLKELHVDIGQNVDAGALLGVIDIPELEREREKQEAMIRQLVADVIRADANVNLEKANVQAAEASRNQARADITKTEAQLTADRAEFNRVEELVSTKSVAARLLDEVRKKLESSQATKISAEAAFESAKANVTVATSRRNVAAAELEASMAATQVARKQLEKMDAEMDYATLKAPFKGVVTERNVDPGDLVRNIQSASDTRHHPLFTIAQLDKVRVRVAVSENDAPWADPGDAVAVQMRAMPGRKFEGKVSRVASSLEETTRTMLIEVDLPNPDGVLLPGMYGEATIVLSVKENTILLPAGAVHYDEQGKSFVYVLSGENQVRVDEVTTGFDDGRQIEITGGLDESARVVDSLIGRLTAGQSVRIEGE